MYLPSIWVTSLTSHFTWHCDRSSCQDVVLVFRDHRSSFMCGEACVSHTPIIKYRPPDEDYFRIDIRLFSKMHESWTTVVFNTIYDTALTTQRESFLHNNDPLAVFMTILSYLRQLCIAKRRWPYKEIFSAMNQCIVYFYLVICYRLVCKIWTGP